MNFKTLTQILNFLPPEFLHKLLIFFLKTELFKKEVKFDNLKCNIFGNSFKNPLGLAAGFDKNAEVIKGILNLGFGYTELGTVTPMPQKGNAKPRVFKIPELEAVIQRLGFNNNGVEEFLQNIKKSKHINEILGANIGKNKNSTNNFSDYHFLYEKLQPYVDYITINISSPNTPGLRDLQEKGNIEKLLKEISKVKKRKPTFLKLSPDLKESNLENICRLILKDNLITGLVLTNTTISRNNLYNKPVKNSWKLSEKGGLSGKPLMNKANEIIDKTYNFTEGKIVIIGVGGISNGKDAFDKISLGANLIQLYTSLIYKGPNVVFNILRDLSQTIERKGLKNINELVGRKISYD